MTPMGTGDAHTQAPLPIFIHGSGGDHRVWAQQTACFDGCAVIELPGHPDGTAVADSGELAQVVARAIDVTARPGVLVGHSLGGALALSVAITRPDLVTGLVIIASGARLPVPDRVMSGLAESFDAECARLLDGFFVDPQGAAVGAAEALVACGPETLAADYAACRSVDLRDRLAEVAVPVLIIAGSDDRFTPRWLSEELARGLPEAQMVVIDDTRHMPMVEAAGAVNRLVGAYLALRAL